MPLTKSEEVTRLEVLGMTGTSIDGQPRINVEIRTTWDDEDDAELPIQKIRHESYERYLYVMEEGATEPTRSDTDLSGAPQIVRDVATVIWTD